MSAQLCGRVVVVDDMESMAEVIQNYCLEVGFSDVVTFLNPVAALAVIRSWPPPALIVSDYHMPEMTGLELLDEARNIYPGIPCILVSGMPEMIKGDTSKYHVIAKEPGFKDVFIKLVREIFKSEA